MQQALVPYNYAFDHRKTNLIPINAGIGKTWIQPEQWSFLSQNSPAAGTKKALAAQKKHQLNLFKAFREELVTLLEILKKHQMENIAGKDKIDAPEGWGLISELYHPMVQNLKKLFNSDPFGVEK